MTREQLEKIPKAELHLHFEGALPLKLLHQKLPGQFPEKPEAWEDDYRFPNFESFDQYLFSMADPYFITIEDHRLAAEDIFAEALENSTRYMEISISSGNIDFHNLNGKELFDTVRKAVPPEITVRLFMGIHHSGFTEKMAPIIEESLLWDSVDGYDLHGLESEAIDPPIPDFWERARKAGKFTKAHAGEFCGPDFIRRILEELKVTRLEHGVRSAEDPALLKEMAQNNIICDVCPISNIKLRAVPSYKEHPIRKLIDAGIRCTVNRDDPIIFGNTIIDDYAVLQEETGLSDEEIIELIKNGFEAAIADQNQKEIWKKEVDDFIAEN